MGGYWPSLFFLHAYGPKAEVHKHTLRKNKANIQQAILAC